MHIPVQVGERTVHATLDGGAQFSVITQMLVFELGLEGLVEEAFGTYTTASGQVERPAGKIKGLEIAINNYKYNLDLIVTKAITYDMLLGMDFQKSNRVAAGSEESDVAATSEEESVTEDYVDEDPVEYLKLVDWEIRLQRCCVIVGIQPGRAPAVDARMQARRRHLRGEGSQGKAKVKSTAPVSPPAALAPTHTAVGRTPRPRHPCGGASGAPTG
ncbi:g5819 [Coccomyxa elongata]